MAPPPVEVVEVKPIFLRAARAALLSWTAAASAEVVPNLYQVDVPVTEQSAAELRRAASAGLAEVLVRVSGRADAGHNPALAPAIAGADRYLDQYRYEHGAANGGQVVRLNFASRQSDQLLRGAGLPVWGANRPNMLVLLAFDDGKGRTLVSEAGHPELVAALCEQALRRGLVVHFPASDAEVQTISTDDVWRLDAGKAQSALSAQHADAVLLGRLSQGGGRWSGAWTLASKEQHSEAEGEGESLGAYLVPSFDKVADALAAQYAVAASGSSESLLVRLVGIANFDDYARALSYLQQIGGVKGVSPVQVLNDQVVLQLRIDGGAEQLTRQLALDNRMQAQAEQNGAALGSQVIQLQLRWAPPASG